MSQGKMLKRYYNASPEGKIMQKRSLTDSKRTDHRIERIKQGKNLHDNFVEDVQKKLNEDLTVTEKLISDKLKDMGINKADINEYMDLWADVIVWPKSDTAIQSRKKMKKLRKELYL